MNAAPPRPAWWFFGCVLALALVLNAALPPAWFTDASNRFGLPAFVLWVIGVLAGFLVPRKTPPRARTAVWVCALGLLMLGEAGSLQVLKQAAFALLIASLSPGGIAGVVIFLAAGSWMPAWGWGWTHLLGTPMDWARPFAAIAPAMTGFLKRGAPAREPRNC